MYAGLEPIGWDVGVSRPRAEAAAADGPRADVEAKMDAFFANYEAQYEIERS